MARDNQNPLLNHALEYHRRGWCIMPIPYGKKAARIKWGKYQKIRPDEKQLVKWFGNGRRNIAVVVGTVSGDLVCRDFDTVQAYESWAAAYPDLAQRLPTVRTARGYHVYFQARIDGTKRLSDGEVRAGGGYCLLPPSVHPDGPVYQWINPLTESNLVVCDPERAGFLPRDGDVTEQTEQTENTEHTEAIVGRGKEDEVEKAIAETLPQEYGTRNRRIFEFARAVKSLPQYADAEAGQLRELAVIWHKRALPNIRTKEFEETWIDFLKAWPKIKYPKGKEPMSQILEKAIRLDPPKIAVEKYQEHSGLKTLVSLCRELQRSAGDNPFFLSARTAGKLLKVSAMQANRWFFLLQTDGILKLVSKGGTAEAVRKASRYRYVAK
jgi:hypothetical protein